MVIPPQPTVSMVTKTIKKNPSPALKKEFTFLKIIYLGIEGIR